jgi:hypothetical protein
MADDEISKHEPSDKAETGHRLYDACEALTVLGYGRPISKKVFLAPLTQPGWNKKDPLAREVRLHGEVLGPKPAIYPLPDAARRMIEHINAGRLHYYCGKPDDLRDPPEGITSKYAVVPTIFGTFEVDEAASQWDIDRTALHLAGNSPGELYFDASDIWRCRALDSAAAQAMASPTWIPLRSILVRYPPGSAKLERLRTALKSEVIRHLIDWSGYLIPQLPPGMRMTSDAHLVIGDARLWDKLVDWHRGTFDWEPQVPRPISVCAEDLAAFEAAISLEPAQDRQVDAGEPDATSAAGTPVVEKADEAVKDQKAAVSVAAESVEEPGKAPADPATGANALAPGSDAEQKKQVGVAALEPVRKARAKKWQREVRTLAEIEPWYRDHLVDIGAHPDVTPPVKPPSLRADRLALLNVYKEHKNGWLTTLKNVRKAAWGDRIGKK